MEAEATEPTTTAPSIAEQKRRAHEGELAFRRTFEKDFAPNPYSEPRSPGAHPGVRLAHLIVRQIRQGRGTPIHGDANVWADFIEANYRSGLILVTAWGPHRQGNFQLGGAMAGLRRGMQGMRPGSRRVIIVPPQLSDTEPGDADRKGRSYKEVVYFDVVLRSILRPEQ